MVMENFKKNELESKKYPREFIEKQITKLLVGIKEIKEISYLRVSGKGEEINISAKIKAKKGITIDIDLEVNLENKDGKISIKDEPRIDAGVFTSKVKNLVSSKLSEVDKILKEYIEKEEGYKIDNICIENGELKTTLVNKKGEISHAEGLKENNESLDFGYLKGKSGKRFNRVESNSEGSFFKIFDISGDIAKFEYSGDDKEAIAKRIFNNNDGVMDVEGSMKDADTVINIEPGELKKDGDGWIVTKPCKIKLVDSKSKQENKEEEKQEETSDWTEKEKNITNSIKEKEAILEKMILDFEILKEKYEEENNLIDEEINRLEKELRYLEDNDKTEKVGSEEKNIADVELEKTLKDISEEEEKKLIEEMGKSKPLEFESDETKKDYKIFVKNQIIKFISGFKIPTKTKETIVRSSKKLLMTTAVMSIWVGNGSFVKPNNVDGKISSLKNKEIINDSVKKFPETGDMETYNQLSENGKRVYLYSLSNIDDSYVIVDKPNAKLYIIGTNKKIVGTMPVLLGQTKGETPNMSNPESDVAEQATTPSGKYTLTRLPTEEGIATYKGKIFNIISKDNAGLAIHITYPPEKEKRSKSLNTPTPDDNRMSWGCINVDEEMWDQYIEGNIKNRGATLFILPDNFYSSLNPNTGEIENVDQDNYEVLAKNFLLNKGV